MEGAGVDAEGPALYAQTVRASSGRMCEAAATAVFISKPLPVRFPQSIQS